MQSKEYILITRPIKPLEYYKGGEVISVERISDGDILNFDPEYNYHVTHDYDYDDPYCMQLVKSAKPNFKNPDYEQEKAKYDDDYRQYKSQLKKWNTANKLYEAEQAELTKQKELQLLKQLQEKYGKID
jgi:hypothetical protein